MSEEIKDLPSFKQAVEKNPEVFENKKFGNQVWNKSHLWSDYENQKKNLELTETLRLSNKNGSLLWLIDKCNTAMGSRLLHKWLDKPLMDKDEINERLDFVEAFNNDLIKKNDEMLNEMFKKQG